MVEGLVGIENFRVNEFQIRDSNDWKFSTSGYAA